MRRVSAHHQWVGWGRACKRKPPPLLPGIPFTTQPKPMFRPNQNKSAAPLIAQSQITCARHFSNLPGFPKEGKENGGGDVTKLPTTTGMANLGFFIGSQPKLWKIKTYENELHHFNDPGGLPCATGCLSKLGTPANYHLWAFGTAN